MCRPGKLLRFSVQEGGLRFDEGGQLKSGDLRFEALASQSRGHADPCSKVSVSEMPFHVSSLLRDRA